MDDISNGDRVSWSSHGSRTTGRVERTITADTREAGRQVRASEDEPQYLVRSDQSGRTAVHRRDALTKE